ncbi:uncharacterized protein [Palaemon carinicauda]|uniref:uncharacterized protein n=1 Tax=Palaemon carinicauda TaxID=392227 RepID=UPI0035B5FCB5
MRRSGRPKCPPVEFWNFERPDYSVSHDISYNISVLGNRSRKQGDSTLQAKTKEFNIVLKDIDKPKASQKGNYDEELKSTKGRRSSKQVETVTNIGNTSKRSFTRDQRKSILTEGKETSRGNEPLLPKNKKTEKNEVLKNDLKNQPTKGNIGNKERKNRDPRGEKGQNMTEASQIHLGESGLPEKRVPSNVRSKAQNRTNRVSEASDSGVTDLDISCGNTLSEARTTEKGADISNIHPG